MIKTLRLSIFISLLLLSLCAAVTNAATPVVAVDKTVTDKNEWSKQQDSVFTHSWNWLLKWLPKRCPVTQGETPYEPKFSQHSVFKVHVYLIGIHPLHNPKRLFEVYGPIVDFLNQHIPEARFKLEASRNYAEFEKKLYAGHFDFALPNPYQTIHALKYGYRVFGKMADDENFRGIILVRRDSGIKQVADLKGKAVSYPAATALAATMLPQYYLHTHGLNINTDIDNRYVGSQESSIMNVLRGYVAAGATWPVPWQTFSREKPELARQLEVKWQTENLPNNSWVVHNRIPTEVTVKLAGTLFSMNQDQQGKVLLAQIPVSRFEAANDDTYQAVRVFLEKFSKTVRPVE